MLSFASERDRQITWIANPNVPPYGKYLLLHSLQSHRTDIKSAWVASLFTYIHRVANYNNRDLNGLELATDSNGFFANKQVFFIIGTVARHLPPPGTPVDIGSKGNLSNPG